MANGPDRVKTMVDGLRRWQAIERKAMEQTAEILEKTSNPFLRMIIEVIRHDSLMHHRVQQLIIDSLVRSDVTLTQNEIVQIWEQIEAHDATEREVVDLAKTLRDQAWTPIHKALLSYLVSDEEKHDRLLEGLDEIKKGISKVTQ